MIIVIGDVRVGNDSLDEALGLSHEHVERSRSEPGCISHDVHQHVDDANRLVFVERWADGDALRTHFAVPASIEFARALTGLADEPPQMDLYEASAWPAD